MLQQGPERTLSRQKGWTVDGRPLCSMMIPLFQECNLLALVSAIPGELICLLGQGVSWRKVFQKLLLVEFGGRNQLYGSMVKLVKTVMMTMKSLGEFVQQQHISWCWWRAACKTVEHCWTLEPEAERSQGFRFLCLPAPPSPTPMQHCYPAPKLFCTLLYFAAVQPF